MDELKCASDDADLLSDDSPTECSVCARTAPTAYGWRKIKLIILAIKRQPYREGDKVDWGSRKDRLGQQFLMTCPYFSLQPEVYASSAKTVAPEDGTGGGRRVRKSN